MSSKLKEVIASHITLSATNFEALTRAAKLKHQGKNTIISRPGKVQDQLFFIEQGLLRTYRIVDGQEYTHFFHLENWFATDFQSFLKMEASQLYIESLTDITYYTFSKKN